MNSTAYYNEIDPYAAAWLRNLIAAGHIAPGVVDERSIEDVRPADLDGFTQCHFFAGIGVWSLALRRAGWGDDRPVWTGSCPCQPFSAAGKGSGFSDQRHLWPAFHWLIQECRPAVILGEQVASSDAGPWLDLVQVDLEAMGHAFGAVAFPSAGVGAPHIRDRLYWVADTHRRSGGKGRAHVRGRAAGSHAEPWSGPGRRGLPSRLADTHGRDSGTEREQCCGEQRQQPQDGGHGVVASGHLANPASTGLQGGERAGERSDAQQQAAQRGGAAGRPGPTNGFWAVADWLGCRDGKWRPVSPGTFPLVAGPAGGVGRVRADWHTPAGSEAQGHRAGRLKGYGNAINAEAARVFIESVMEASHG